MAAKKKVGDLIKEARTNAGLSQTALAAKMDGVSAADIGKAERGEKELTQAALRQIAKATGVTQKSLLDAAAGTSSAAAKKPAATTAAKKPAATTAAKKPAATTAAKKPAASTAAKKTSSSTGTSVKVTAAEKKLLELYRAADADKKKAAVSILKGETPEAGDLLSSLLGGAMDMLQNLGKK